MFQWYVIVGVLILSYLVGAIPSGWIVVKIASGKDVRTIESGRTGGTNAMRAAGFLAGLITVILDAIKGLASGWIVNWLAPGSGTEWLRVFSAVAAILGHNYSVFLIEKGSSGELRLRGGAGGATAMGGAVALWSGTLFIVLPLAALTYLLVGYASVTTMSIAFFSMLIFAVRAIQGLGPWEYVAYGAMAYIVVVWALRPNIARLIKGTERPVGLRAYFKKKNAKI